MAPEVTLLEAVGGNEAGATITVTPKSAKRLIEQGYAEDPSAAAEREADEQADDGDEFDIDSFRVEDIDPESLVAIAVAPELAGKLVTEGYAELVPAGQITAADADDSDSDGDSSANPGDDSANPGDDSAKSADQPPVEGGSVGGTQEDGGADDTKVSEPAKTTPKPRSSRRS